MYYYGSPIGTTKNYFQRVFIAPKTGIPKGIILAAYLSFILNCLFVCMYVSTLVQWLVATFPLKVESWNIA